MAEKKFSQLTAKAATIADTDLVAISESAGGGTYVSKSVTGANIKALVTDANLVTSDITTNDVSITKHGFVPKAPNDATQFLDGTGAFDTVKDTDLSLSDNTTNDVSISQHGFVPKAPNNTTTFLRGDGTWATPASGGLTNFTEAANSSAPNGTVPVNSLTATGAATNIDVAIVPKGTGAFTLAIPDGTGPGGAKRGAGAVDLQLTRGYFARVASGTNSFAAGSECTASGANSIAIGNNSAATATKSYSFGQATASSQYALSAGSGVSATGYSSTCLGSFNTASGQESTAIGGYGNIASSTYSLAIGRECTSNGVGSTAIGFKPNSYSRYGSFAVAGGSPTAQWVKMIYRGNTTDATLTSLNAQEYFDDANNTFSLQNNSTYRFKGTVIGKQSGSTNVAAWDIDGLIVRGSGAATTSLVIGNVNLVSNTPSWGTPVLSANTTFGSLKVQVQGAVSTSIRWAVNIEAIEVIYA